MITKKYYTIIFQDIVINYIYLLLIIVIVFICIQWINVCWLKHPLVGNSETVWVMNIKEKYAISENIKDKK